MRKLNAEQVAMVAASPYFDADWYLQQYPDVKSSGLSAIDHYGQFGSALGRDPGPNFSQAEYCLRYPDVANSGIDPLLHFLTRGQAENRDAFPSHGRCWFEQRLPWQELTVVHQNELESVGQGQLMTTGVDPYLVYVVPASLQQPGWLLLRIKLHSSESVSARVKWYLDDGQGFSEQQAFTDTVQAGPWHCRLLRLDEALQFIRLDPTDQPNIRLHADVSIVLLSDTEAMNWMQLKQSLPAPDWLEKLAEQASGDNSALLDLAFHQYQLSGLLGGFSYAAWQREYEGRTRWSESELEAFLAAQHALPLISVVMPVYNAPLDFLALAIASVQAQRYPHWQLCIADDASTNPEVRQLLERAQQDDPRIEVDFRAENGHISAASNSALVLVKGDWVALMDHDDLLAEDALLYMAQAILQHPDAKVFYSDEDKVDEKGRRYEPHFKPDWNRDLFLSQNYLSHLGVYSAELLRRIGGFRQGVEGSQDQDLMLRCLLHIEDSQIVHVPRILYHWRALEGSTALASAEKSYTSEAGIRALQHYFEAAGMPDVQVSHATLANTYRVEYPIPEPAPLVSMLIPTRDKLELLQPCVDSILQRSSYRNFEILILDNGSCQAETLAYFDAVCQRDQRVQVLRYDHPFNYSAINNFGAKHAKGEILALINNDIEVIHDDWLTAMVQHAIRPEIGCVGAKLYFDDDTIQHAGVVVGLGGVAGHSHKHFPRSHPGYFGRLVCVQNYLAVTAACLLVRKAVFEEVGGLNEHDLKVAFNDVDFCLKVHQAGYRNLWTPYAELYHYESKSRGLEDTPEKMARFQLEIDYIRQQWPDLIAHDPCYSKYLTRSYEDFSVQMG